MRWRWRLFLLVTIKCLVAKVKIVLSQICVLIWVCGSNLSPGQVTHSRYSGTRLDKLIQISLNTSFAASWKYLCTNFGHITKSKIEQNRTESVKNNRTEQESSRASVFLKTVVDEFFKTWFAKVYCILLYSSKCVFFLMLKYHKKLNHNFFSESLYKTFTS